MYKKSCKTKPCNLQACSIELKFKKTINKTLKTTSFQKTHKIKTATKFLQNCSKSKLKVGRTTFD